MPASFAYGRQNGVLVHIGNLNPLEHRGLLCDCVCPECGRKLQAHMGQLKAWHFQHHVEDANCNPQPMTLLHAFVRDELAARKAHVIPLIEEEQEFVLDGHLVRALVRVPAFPFEPHSTECESRGDGVQPDVVCTLTAGTTIALEVKYTHAVDEAKRRRLESGYSLALEFDVSDLSAGGVTREELELRLKEAHRWTWLAGAPLHLARGQAGARLAWAQSHWRMTAKISNEPEVKPASEKLRQVARRVEWAKTQLQALKTSGVKGMDGARWLGQQTKGDRVALACAALGINPNQFPAFLQQLLPNGHRPRFALAHHPYSWQAPVFLKFCIGKKEFSAHDAAEWCAVAMPDRCEQEDGTKSLNGFTQTAAALQLYFLQLETQDLLRGIPASALEWRRFKPAFESVAQLHASGRLD